MSHAWIGQLEEDFPTRAKQCICVIVGSYGKITQGALVLSQTGTHVGQIPAVICAPPTHIHLFHSTAVKVLH